jgi:peptidoglycan/xylan/chitin deacetylase (PgdA/CDA1 family)
MLKRGFAANCISLKSSFITDAVEIVSGWTMQSIISLTFDDGLRCHFEQALPILNSHGFRATFFLVANSDRVLKDGFRHPRWNKTNWSRKDTQLLAGMIQQGHEIGSHSVHHKHPFLDKDPRFEAEASKKWIEDRLGIEVSSYCYPFCHFSDPIKDAVMEAGYKQARWGAHESYYPLQDPLDKFKVDCRLVAKFGYERVRDNFIGKYGAENVDAWARPACWHVLMFHGIGGINDGWWPIPIAEFAREMADLAVLRDSGAVEVVTFEEGAKRFGCGGQG